MASRGRSVLITEADDLRKAIGKKIRALMNSLKDKFLEGAAEQNVTPGVAKQLWEDVEKAADYSFPKAHAACYALIAYQTAWLRQNHPCEYMAALISSVMSTKDRVPIYVNACHELGIEVLPPDVNESQVDFAVVEGKIRFGLNAVKGVGEGAARALITARTEGGPFESIWDFAGRSVVSNKRVPRRSSCGARLARARRLEALETPCASVSSNRRTGCWPGLDLRSGADREIPRKHPTLSTDEFDKGELPAPEGGARPAVCIRRYPRSAVEPDATTPDHAATARWSPSRIARAPHDDEAR